MLSPISVAIKVSTHLSRSVTIQFFFSSPDWPSILSSDIYQTPLLWSTLTSSVEIQFLGLTRPACLFSGVLSCLASS